MVFPRRKAITFSVEEKCSSLRPYPHILKKPPTYKRICNTKLVGKFLDCIESFSCFGSTKKVKPQNLCITMTPSNIIPFQVSVGHLEPHEDRPLVSLPQLPQIQDPRSLRAVLKIYKAKPERSTASLSRAAEFSDEDEHNDTLPPHHRGMKTGWARAGHLVIGDVVDHILSNSEAAVSAIQRDRIKATITSDNQAHYFAMLYHMEQHIHGQKEWALLTTKDLGDVFRAYIGVLTTNNEVGYHTTWAWLENLLYKLVTEELSYTEWRARMAAEPIARQDRLEYEKENEISRDI
ncbi:hypothetical protein TWF694_008282 [Orbilia ellipsospora]|uniref:Uncharacterized protein n=1 Tax=Orbilia ellipsospora TaxID=2528407 RepID=A0AAV9XG57_9PEZI